MKSIDEIAEELRVAHEEDRSRQALASLLADRVEVHHHPPVPSDGPTDRATMAAGLSTDPYLEAAPGLRRELVSISVDADQIDVRTRITGVLPDGALVEAPLRFVCTIADGEIVGLDTYPDAAASIALMEQYLAATADSERSELLMTILESTRASGST